MPIGLIMRKMYNTYPEYHTSLDNLNFINVNTIIESINVYFNVLMSIENNFIPTSKIKFGTPQLGKSKINIYPDMHSEESRSDKVRIMLEILNLSEGTDTILDMAIKKNFSLVENIDVLEKLIQSGYIFKDNIK